MGEGVTSPAAPQPRTTKTRKSRAAPDGRARPAIEKI